MPSQFYYIRVYLSNSVVHLYKEISTMDPVSSLLHRRNIRIQHGLRLSHHQPAASGILDISSTILTMSIGVRSGPSAV